MKRLLVRFGASHNQYRKQRQAFADAGMELRDAGSFTLGSKARAGIIPDTPEARELLRKVGGTIARKQWAHLQEEE